MIILIVYIFLTILGSGIIGGTIAYLIFGRRR